MSSKYTVKFVETSQELEQARQLRLKDLLLAYNTQCTAQTDDSDGDNYSKIVIVKDELENVIATYRLTDLHDLPQGKTFACEEEFDITLLKQSTSNICEASRAVVAPEHRNGIVLAKLMLFVVQYVKSKNYKYVIGDASFFGVDKTQYLQEFSLLANNYCIDSSLGVTAKDNNQLQLLPSAMIDAKQVMRKLPPLIRLYIMMGAKFATQFFSDYEFKSIDAFVLMDVDVMDFSFLERIVK